MFAYALIKLAQNSVCLYFQLEKKTLRRFNIYVMFYGSSIEKSNIISQLKSPAS